MQVVEIKPGDPVPPRAMRGEGFVNKLKGYVQVLEKIKAGQPVNTILRFDAEDQKIAGGLPTTKIAEKVIERMRKRLERCYRKGQVADRNYEVYQGNGEVVIRQLPDNNTLGFAHSQRGKKAIPATNTATEVKGVGKTKKKGGVN